MRNASINFANQHQTPREIHSANKTHPHTPPTAHLAKPTGWRASAELPEGRGERQRQWSEGKSRNWIWDATRVEINPRPPSRDIRINKPKLSDIRFARASYYNAICVRSLWCARSTYNIKPVGEIRRRRIMGFSSWPGGYAQISARYAP